MRQLQQLCKRRALKRLLWNMTNDFMLAGLYLEHGQQQEQDWTVQPLAPDFAQVRCHSPSVTTRGEVKLCFDVPLVPNSLLGQTAGKGWLTGFAAVKSTDKPRTVTAERVNLQKLLRVVRGGLFHSMYAGGFSSRLGFKFELLPVGQWKLTWAPCKLL